MKSVELFIKGKKVIDVGYRPFLLLNALKQGIQNINAFNTIEEGKEMVVVRLQGEDDRVTSYINFLRSNFPVQSVVEEIIEREFDGLVEDAFKFAQILQFEQIAKAIPFIISIDKKQDIMIEKQDIMIEKQDIMIEKQDIMIEKQDIMIGKQDTTIGILESVKEDTSAIRTDISDLRKDTRESLLVKYEELYKEIAEIKATLVELKAKAA